MEAAVWLAFYLALGFALLWACHSSVACRLRSRLERNKAIAARFGLQGPDRTRGAPH